MNIKEIITESGLSRLSQWTKSHDYGIISACRAADPEGNPYTSGQNAQRSASLQHKLRALRLGVTKVKGSYIENYGTPEAVEVAETSFVVIDIQNRGDLKKILMALGEEFDQDCILYGPKGGAGTLIGTNHTGYPGYHQEQTQGGAVFGKSGEFMSRVKGRPFIFNESTDLEILPEARYPSELRGPVLFSKKHWSELDPNVPYGVIK